MNPWTEEQVIAAAPDPNSVNAGRKLAVPGPWSETGCNDALLWGQCQGSGKKPYQVSIDLAAPAYRCSCPSRKFPCKHALALLFLWSRGHVGGGAELADFAQSWSESRAARTRKRTEAPPDPEAQAKRQAERIAKMDAGVADFALWLGDLARSGISGAMKRDRGWWEAAASRLVDAQLPGLADRVRGTADALYGGLDATGLLHEIGRWWMLTRAWQRRDDLPENHRADLRAALGWPIPSAEVRAGETVDGTWVVAGAHRTDDGRLQQQRTWLRGEDGGFVIVLDTAGPGQTLAVPQLTGARLRARLALYPGSAPRRALFADPPESLGAAADLDGGGTIADALDSAATNLSATPWRERFPAVLNDVRPAVDPGTGEPGGIVDAAGASLALVPGTDLPLLLALTGGDACRLFGELDGGGFRPLAVAHDGAVVSL